MPNLSCGIPSTINSPWAHFLLWEGYILLASFLLVGYPLYWLFKKYRSKKFKIVFPVFAIVFFFILLGMSAILFLFTFLVDDNPPSYKYHVLNAAIKNTCYLDPQKNHCPKTAEELINIEPENFTRLIKDANLTYRYYPETNEYTFIVRNNDYWRNNNRVVIFDPRLIKTKNYGSGLDFVDAKISTCKEGKYTLQTPPPFNGPWDEIE